MHSNTDDTALRNRIDLANKLATLKNDQKDMPPLPEAGSEPKDAPTVNFGDLGKLADTVISIWKGQGYPEGFVRLCSGWNYDMDTGKHESWHESWMSTELNLKDTELKTKVIAYLAAHNGWDLYFSPVIFTQSHGQHDYAMATKFVAIDIDEGPLDAVPYNYLWTTSKGRHSGLIEYDDYVPVADAEAINKKMVDKKLIDQGNGTITKVVRIPGSMHLKDKANPQQVGEMQATGRVLNKTVDMKKLLGITDAPTVDATVSRELIPVLSSKEFNEIVKQHGLEVMAQNMMTRPLQGDDRSGRIFGWAKDLCEKKVPEEDTCRLLKYSPWNSWPSKRNNPLEADSMLQKDVFKAYQEVKSEITKKPVEDAPLRKPIRSLQEFLTTPTMTPEWDIVGVIPYGAKVLLAGKQKSGKSTLNYRLAVSCATGLPFLNMFEVKRPGRVLFVDFENTEREIKAQLFRTMTSTGLLKESQIDFDQMVITDKSVKIPEIDIIDQTYGVGLTPESMKKLETYIDEVKPAYLFIDPVYTTMEGNNNDIMDVGPIVGKLTEWRTKYCLSVIASHHFSKSHDSNIHDSNKVLGSVGWGAWWSTYIALENKEQTKTGMKLLMVRQFRGYGAADDAYVDFKTTGRSEAVTVREFDPSKVKEPVIDTDKPDTIEDAIIRAIEAKPGIFEGLLIDDVMGMRGRGKRWTDYMILDTRNALAGEGRIRLERLGNGKCRHYLSCPTISEEEHAKNVAAV